ncbi:unnamed protein product, partial [Polarella glacialis]
SAQGWGIDPSAEVYAGHASLRCGRAGYHRAFMVESEDSWAWLWVTRGLADSKLVGKAVLREAPPAPDQPVLAAPAIEAAAAVQLAPGLPNPAVAVPAAQVVAVPARALPSGFGGAQLRAPQCGVCETPRVNDDFHGAICKNCEKGLRGLGNRKWGTLSQEQKAEVAVGSAAKRQCRARQSEEKEQAEIARMAAAIRLALAGAAA